MEEVDRYILARYAGVAKKVLAAYEEYDYGAISQALTQFATVDLSSFYNDISKDGLYTLAAGSPRAALGTDRAVPDGGRPDAPAGADSVLHGGRALALSAGQSRRVGPRGAVPDRGRSGCTRRSGAGRAVGRLLALRERVLAEIEPLRKNKQIGSSLQAKVVLTATPGDLATLRQHERHLPMLFIVSDVELSASPADVIGAAGGATDGKPVITIARASGIKCERCWRIVPAVSSAPEWAGLCDRCQDALAVRAARG